MSSPRPRLETGEDKKRLLLPAASSPALREALENPLGFLRIAFRKSEEDETFWLKNISESGEKLFTDIGVPSILSTELTLEIGGQPVPLENAVVALKHFFRGSKPQSQLNKITGEQLIAYLDLDTIGFLVYGLYADLEKNGYRVKNKTAIKITREKNEYTEQEEYFVYLDSDITAIPSESGLPELNIGRVQWRLKLNPDVGLQLESVAVSTPTSELDTHHLKEFVLHNGVKEEDLDGMVPRPVVDEENILTPKELEKSENIIFAGTKKKEAEEESITESKDSEEAATSESKKSEEFVIVGLKETHWINKDRSSTWEQLFKDADRTLLINGQSFKFSEENKKAQQEISELDPSIQREERKEKIDSINKKALRSFIQRVFEKRKLFSSHISESKEDFDTLFEQLGTSYCQYLGGAVQNALPFGVLAALGLPTTLESLAESGIALECKNRKDNLFLGSDGKIYFEIVLNDAVILDAYGSQNWPGDRLKIEEPLYGKYILTPDGFKLLSIQSANDVALGLCFGGKATPALPLEGLLEELKEFKKHFSHLTAEEKARFRMTPKPAKSSRIAPLPSEPAKELSVSGKPAKAPVAPTTVELAAESASVKPGEAPVVSPAAAPLTSVVPPAAPAAAPLASQQAIVIPSANEPSASTVAQPKSNVLRNILLGIGAFLLLAGIAGAVVGISIATLGIGPVVALIATALAYVHITAAISAPLTLLIGGAACFVAEAIIAGIGVGIAAIANKFSRKSSQQSAMDMGAIQEQSSGEKVSGDRALKQTNVIRALAKDGVPTSSAPASSAASTASPDAALAAAAPTASQRPATPPTEVPQDRSRVKPGNGKR